MTSFSPWSVLAVDDDEDEQNEKKKTNSTLEELPEKSTRADCCDDQESDFITVVKKTKKRGNGDQNKTCIGKLVFVHPSGRWGKVLRQDTEEYMYTKDPPSIPEGSRVKFVCGENHFAVSVEVV